MTPASSGPQDSPLDRLQDHPTSTAYPPAPPACGSAAASAPAPAPAPALTGVDLNAKDPSEKALWDLAVRRLKEKQEFRGHAVAYVLVNSFLVALWWISGAGFFWPAFPMLGWGIGLGMHAWSAFGRSVATQEEIRHEMERIRRQR